MSIDPESRETAKECIRRLKLEPLEREGGFFRRIYTAEASLGKEGKRKSASSILYLMTGESFSRLHRLVSAEELWFFLGGAPADHLTLFPGGEGRHLSLEPGSPWALVPSGAWQGARLRNPSSGEYALFGITVSPEYQPEEYELPRKDDLMKAYAPWASLILPLL